MDKLHKYRIIMTVVVTVILVVAIVVLTNDYFDEFEHRNTILVTLMILQSGITVFNLMFRSNRKELS